MFGKSLTVLVLTILAMYQMAGNASAQQMDGAILVVSADDGPMPQTKQPILLSRHVGDQETQDNLWQSYASMRDNEFHSMNQAELADWYEQAYDYYQQVQSGAVSQPTQAQWQDFLDQMNWAQQQLAANRTSGAPHHAN